MCYYPYFRGKQYELITIRENAVLLQKSNFIPIIEPVKLKGLKATLEALVEANGKAIVIANPYHGDFSNDNDNIPIFLNNNFNDLPNIMPGIRLSEEHTFENAKQLYLKHNSKSFALIHAGFSDAKSFVKLQEAMNPNALHFFQEENCGKIYRSHFIGPKKVLLRDGFVKRNNRNYPKKEFFSDLHVTFREENMQGFGDFLIVGDDYSETGGPAYAIAIHITFIDEDRDNEMHIYHFVSDRQDDPKDPAGKFFEALDKLVRTVKSQDNNIFHTTAIQEFIELHNREHYPGLGYVKKMSMQHHLETLANYFKR